MRSRLTSGSAVEEPILPPVELCTLTAFSISQGQRVAEALQWPFIAAASVETTPMVRSAIGLRSWSYGGLITEAIPM